MKKPFIDRQLTYLKMLQMGSLAIILFYTLKFNISYSQYALNGFLIPLFLINLVPSIIYFYTKNYNWSAYSVLIAPSLSLTFFLAVAGGLSAPGIFWPTALPMLGALLLGKRGTLMGASLALLIFAALYFSQSLDLLPNVISNQNEYNSEKNLNLILFSIYSVFITSVFINTESRILSTLDEQKHLTENLLRIIIHDIASPLTVIKMSLKRFSPNSEPAQFEKTIKLLDRQTENMIQILSKVREMRAIADGKSEIHLQPQNVEQIVNETVEILKPKAEEKKIQLLVQTNNCKNISILTDAPVFKNVVLANLITNAIKFSPENTQILVSCISENGKVQITVRDYGIGIPQELMNNLFNLNVATTRQGTKGEKGTGYGMLLVKEWVGRMNGTLEVQSKTESDSPDDHGTLFTITLPITEAIDQKAVA